MSQEITQIYDPSIQDTPDQLMIRRHYNVVVTTAAEDDEDDVVAYVKDETSSTLSMSGTTYYRRDVSADRIGHMVWDVLVTYTASQSQTVWTFDTTGGTSHIVSPTGSSLPMTYLAPGYSSSPDPHGLIGNDGRSVRGVDIVTPTLNIQTHAKVPEENVPSDYIATLAELTGTVNNSTFMGYELGELLFKGARGGFDAAREWFEIDYYFGVRFNRYNFYVGDVLIDFKAGWDVLDVQTETNVSDNRLVQRIICVNVWQVYDRSDFTRLDLIL